MAAIASGSSASRAKAAARDASNVANCQRLARLLVLRIEAAQALVVDFVVIARPERHHFISDADELVIPVGTRFVKVEVRLILESQFDGARGADMFAECFK